MILLIPSQTNTSKTYTTNTLKTMTKKQLLDLISDYPDNSEVVIEVHDTTLHEDLYDFTLDPIQLTRFNHEADNPMDSFDYKIMYELRLCPIKNEQ